MSLLDNLFAFWTLNEISGPRTDSWRTNDLTDNNTVTSAVGKINGAGQFTAANSEYLSSASTADLQSGDIDITLVAWVYLDSKVNQTFVSKWGAASSDREYRLGYLSTSDRFLFEKFTPGTGIISLEASTFGAPSIATWYLVIAWHDAAANQLGISINAGAADTLSDSDGLQVGSGSFAIGAFDDAGFANFANGRIGPVGYWKRVLTANERTALYDSGNGLSYPFLVQVGRTEFIGASAVAQGTAADLTVTLPTGRLVGDVLLWHAHSRDNNTHTYPAGWRKITQINQGTNFTHSWAWRRMDGSEGSTATVTISGTNCKQSKMAQFRGLITSGAPFSGFSTAQATSTTVDPAALTIFNPHDLIVALIAVADDNALAAMSGGSNVDTVTEAYEHTTTLGLDGNIVMDWARPTAVGSVDLGSATMASDPWVAYTIALSPEQQLPPLFGTQLVRLPKRRPWRT